MIQFTDADMLSLLAAYLLPFFRILGLFTAAPVLSQRATPAKARVGMAFVIAFVAAPTINPANVTLDSSMIPLAVHEVAVGLMLGFMARVVFAAFEVAGETIGLQMGLSFAGFFDPQSGASNPVSRLLNLIALTGFVMLNGPGLLIAAVIASFQTIPIGVEWAWLARQSPATLGTEMFALALAIALPFIIMLLFVNLALGIMSRVAPQFSIFSVGFPITIGVGLTLLTFAIPLLDTPLLQAIAILERVMS